MPSYTQTDLLRLAKRVNNTRRSYLLVNPLQAKHIPASPSKALEMMDTLGEALAQKYPGTRLVIGFAETATAIGAAVAGRFEDCIYLPTTREEVPEVGEWVIFSEEHSHATLQKLCGDRLEERIRVTDSLIFVDDEISTGKTLLNMILQLKERYPQLAEKKLAAASLINRMTPEDRLRLESAGVACEYLLKVTDDRAAELTRDMEVEKAAPVTAGVHNWSRLELDGPPLPNPRGGIEIQRYRQCCEALSRSFLEAAGPRLQGLDSAVVLGTEECMYPALVLGRDIEERGLPVRCHATTRSPIGICSAPGYPITRGNKLSSFYEAGRETYLYNFAPCGGLIILSDAPSCRMEALEQLAAAWAPYGFERLFFVQGGQHVWYL